MKDKPKVLIVDDNNELLSGMKLFCHPTWGRSLPCEIQILSHQPCSKAASISSCWI